MVLCSFFLAKVTANFVALQFEGGLSPPSIRVGQIESSLTKKDKVELKIFQAILDRNIFDSREQVITGPIDDPEIGPETNPTGEAVLTSLPIKLLSTFSVGKGEDKRSSCVITGTSKSKESSDNVYIVGMELTGTPQSKVVRILPKRVEFINKGRLEYVQLEDFSSKVAQYHSPSQEDNENPVQKQPPTQNGETEVNIEQVGENKFILKRAEVEAAMADLNALAQDILVLPAKDGPGFEVRSVKRGGIFTKLGIKRGDVLMSVNGTQLTMQSGFGLFAQLKNESRFEIEINRRGTALKFEYEIQD